LKPKILVDKIAPNLFFDGVMSCATDVVIVAQSNASVKNDFFINRI
jgi:hypothetical protein